MNIKDGDYFSYHWKEGKGPSTDPYWCRDCRCVARTNPEGEIELIDTHNYWTYNSSDEIFSYEGLSREYSRYVTTDKFDLEFIVNLNDLKVIKEYEKEDYDDVYEISYHSRYRKLFATLKDSDKSNNAILKKYERKIEEANEKKRSAESDIEYYSRLIQELGE